MSVQTKDTPNQSTNKFDERDEFVSRMMAAKKVLREKGVLSHVQFIMGSFYEDLDGEERKKKEVRVRNAADYRTFDMGILAKYESAVERLKNN